jgi:Tol biopolymer transport system component
LALHASQLFSIDYPNGDQGGNQICIRTRPGNEPITLHKFGADVTTDGKRICTSSRYDQTARVWDADTGKSLVEIKQERLAFAEFSPDGKQILAVAYQGDAVLWDATTGKRLRQLASPYAKMRRASWLYSASFSPDGNRVALVDWHRL